MTRAYTLALASIMLTAGSTADRIGAKKVHVPLAVAAGGYLVALALAWIAIRSRS